ncbi:hypothetical protein ACFV6B_13315 [Streptomyces microflavus]|uniref:hypothetical protein n=1 Tax=Streptomyces microflavus TaxID=1919 RepID=UPI0036607DB4
MTTPHPRPAGRIRTAARTIRTIAKWVFLGTSALLWVLLISIGIITDPADDEPTPTTAASEPAAPPADPGTPIEWNPVGQSCADGWPSRSIGKRGACSHHGGVVTVYGSSLGNLTTRCHPYGHPETLERARELADTTRTVPCEFPDDE